MSTRVIFSHELRKGLRVCELSVQYVTFFWAGCFYTYACIRVKEVTQC